jgi:flagellar hook-associated protein 2
VKDNQPMTDAIQAFVDAYNSLQTTISNQTKYTAVDQGSTSQEFSNGDLLATERYVIFRPACAR